MGKSSTLFELFTAYEQVAKARTKPEELQSLARLTGILANHARLAWARKDSPLSPDEAAKAWKTAVRCQQRAAHPTTEEAERIVSLRMAALRFEKFLNRNHGGLTMTLKVAEEAQAEAGSETTIEDRLNYAGPREDGILTLLRQAHAVVNAAAKANTGPVIFRAVAGRIEWRHVPAYLRAADAYGMSIMCWEGTPKKARISSRFLLEVGKSCDVGLNGAPEYICTDESELVKLSSAIIAHVAKEVRDTVDGA